MNSLPIRLSVSTALLLGCAGQSAAPSAVAPVTIALDDAAMARVQRGKQLVSFGACHDCHTPWKFDPEIGSKVPDMSRMLSGHPQGAPDPAGTLGEGDMAVIGPTFTAFRMPFGVIHAPNLTPDLDTGTGSWTEQMFLGVFRKGKHLGGDGRPVLPPMPWPMTASLPDEDIKAIYAYLRTVKPIRNAVPVANPPPEVQRAIDASNQRLLERIRAAREGDRQPMMAGR